MFENLLPKYISFAFSAYMLVNTSHRCANHKWGPSVSIKRARIQIYYEICCRRNCMLLIRRNAACLLPSSLLPISFVRLTAFTIWMFMFMSKVPFKEIIWRTWQLYSACWSREGHVYASTRHLMPWYVVVRYDVSLSCPWTNYFFPFNPKKSKKILRLLLRRTFHHQSSQTNQVGTYTAALGP